MTETKTVACIQQIQTFITLMRQALGITSTTAWLVHSPNDGVDNLDVLIYTDLMFVPFGQGEWLRLTEDYNLVEKVIERIHTDLANPQFVWWGIREEDLNNPLPEAQLVVTYMQPRETVLLLSSWYA